MPPSIKEFPEKIKTAARALEQRDIFVTFLIILVGAAGFGLGKLSALQADREDIEVVQTASIFDSLDNTAGDGSEVATGGGAQNGQFVGSVNSDKYHYPWCSGAKRIKNENKIWFDTKEEAEAQGYAPAGNCKGL